MLIDQLDHRRMAEQARKAIGGASGDVMAQEWLAARTNAFEISNVFDMLRHDWGAEVTHDGRTVNVGFAKYPNVAPPFRSYWMEWENKVGGHWDRFGVWCDVAAETTDAEWHVSLAIWGGSRKPKLIGSLMLAMPRDGSPAREAAPMRAYLDAWPGMRRGAKPEDLSVTLTEQDKAEAHRVNDLPDGPDKERRKQALVDRINASAEADNETLGQTSAHMLRLLVLPPVLMAHSLLGCKNVGTDSHPIPPKVNRAHQRRHGQPKVTFKTLRINPFGPKRGHGGESRGDVGDGIRAQHICRGHFKTFTAERPLFGRVVGTYWWESQLRGNAAAGTVVKDYKVG